MTEAKDKGWIKVDRDVLEEWFWDEGVPFDRMHAWLDILLNVNYKAQQFSMGETVITINEGCILTSASKLAKRWTWDRKRVTKFLKLLQSCGKIDYKRLGNGILIEVLQENKDNPKTLENTESEAFFYTPEGQPVVQPIGQPVVQPIGQPMGQPLHTNKESNKDNKVLEGEKGRKEEDEPSQPKIKYSENVFLTKREYDELVSDLGEADANVVIGIVDEYKERTGKVYENDFLAIRKWGIKAFNERRRDGRVFRKDAEVKRDEPLASLDDEFERLMWEKMERGDG